MVERVACLLSREGLGVYSKLYDLLTKVIEKHVTHVFHLLLDI